MAAPLPVGTRVDIVATTSQMHGEWGIVVTYLGDGEYLVAPWGGDTAQLFDRRELRGRKTEAA